MSHKKLVKAAEEAIDELFGDTSVSQQQTLEDMLDLKSAIEQKVDCLMRDLKLR